MRGSEFLKYRHTDNKEISVKVEHEIRGIDQAVVLLMFALDRVFAHRVDGWHRARNGYQIEHLLSNRNTTIDLSVMIYPIGLKKSDHIFCRFSRIGEEWVPYKGHVSQEHTAKEIAGFAFDGTNATIEGVPLDFVIKARSDEAKFNEILARDLIYDCKRA